MARQDHKQIVQWIDLGARVLDLGCEDGELLLHLRDAKNARGIGVDINNTQLTAALQKGLTVVHTDIRRGLSLFADGAFDYVVLSQTLQSIDQPPDALLREMLRVGRAAIVSFPNFAHYPLRWQLLRGRMPEGRNLPYAWHNTPNLRYCTIKDFEKWCAEQGLTISDKSFLAASGPIRHLSNLRAETAVYRLTR